MAGAGLFYLCYSIWRAYFVSSHNPLLSVQIIMRNCPHYALRGKSSPTSNSERAQRRFCDCWTNELTSLVRLIDKAFSHSSILFDIARLAFVSVVHLNSCSADSRRWCLVLCMQQRRELGSFWYELIESHLFVDLRLSSLGYFHLD
jgi:hypothetical protein